MTKGLLGEGSGHSGDINDEDWGLVKKNDNNEIVAVKPYQNALGPAGSTIRYLTIDGGYNLFVGPGYRLSPFVGYSHFSQAMRDFGLFDITFSPPTSFGATLLLLQFTTWNALRVGAAADFMLTPSLKLNVDAAWLPEVHLQGLDVHVPNRSGPRRLSPARCRRR
jgi:hypothetical protein